MNLNRLNLITFIAALVITAMMLASPTPGIAQCSMCKAIAESGANDNTINVARGLNSGILYLLSIPYVLGGVAFFIWRRNRKKTQALES